MDDEVGGGQIEPKNNDYYGRDLQCAFDVIKPELAHVSSPCDTPALHLKNSINERSKYRSGRNNYQSAEQSQPHDDWKEPEFFSLFHKPPHIDQQLTHNASHLNKSIFDDSEAKSHSNRNNGTDPKCFKSSFEGHVWAYLTKAICGQL